MYPEYRWSEHVREHEDSRLRKRSFAKSPRNSISIDGSSTPITPTALLTSNPFSSVSAADEQCRTLPFLALNEVYIGESLSSRVSYYELQTDDQERVKQKSSGITICTGTGSTSWYFNINKLTEHCVRNLIEIMEEEVGHNGLNISGDDSALIGRVCKKFNDKLIFCPSDLRMAYAVRDPVFNATFFASPSTWIRETYGDQIALFRCPFGYRRWPILYFQ